MRVIFRRTALSQCCPDTERPSTSDGRGGCRMKRILLVAVSSSALALAAPGIALAHHHHAKRHAHRHGARVHVLDFRASAAPTTTAPSSPVTPVAPTGGETAGKVTSFKEGVLTIT